MHNGVERRTIMKLRHARKRLKLRTYTFSAWVKPIPGDWTRFRRTLRRLNADHGMSLFSEMMRGKHADIVDVTMVEGDKK